MFNAHYMGLMCISLHLYPANKTVTYLQLEKINL